MIATSSGLVGPPERLRHRSRVPAGAIADIRARGTHRLTPDAADRVRRPEGHAARVIASRCSRTTRGRAISSGRRHPGQASPTAHSTSAETANRQAEQRTVPCFTTHLSGKPTPSDRHDLLNQPIRPRTTVNSTRRPDRPARNQPLLVSNLSDSQPNSPEPGVQAFHYENPRQSLAQAIDAGDRVQTDTPTGRLITAGDSGSLDPTATLCPPSAKLSVRPSERSCL